jgi:uncharacterized membrane protein
MSTWKRDFASGLVVLAPILVILFVLGWFYNQITQLPFIKDLQGYAQLYYVILSLVIFLLLIFSVGYLMRTTLGRLVEDLIDAAMNRVPLIRVVYNASKLAVETALTGTEELKTPVRLETWNGLRMTAFKTGKRTEDGRVVIFLPTAPNITSGFVVEVEESRIEETDEKVEEALTRILSAGFAEDSEPGIDIDVIDEVSADDPHRTNDD